MLNDVAGQADNVPGAADCLAGGGEMGTLLRSLDWTKTALGPVEHWPQSLRTAVSICLNSRFPIVLWWGPELRLIYNDAWRPVLGNKHPAVDRPGREVWPEIWHIIGPRLEGVLTKGEATWSDDELLMLERFGYAEEAYFTYSYSPIRDETGRVGVFAAVSETTHRVLSERRLKTLRDLVVQASEAKSVAEACQITIRTVAENPYDVPFAAVYLLEGESAARLAASTLGVGNPAFPRVLELPSSGASPGWPLAEVLRSGRTELVADVIERFGNLPGSPDATPPREALVLPLRASGQDRLAGFLVAGVNPCRALDDQYHAFFDLMAGHVAAAVANAHAYAEERRRAETLAELDRAKTAFFSNVSHEFRTPLTLMLGPLEDSLADGGTRLHADDRERLTVAHRNSLRLLKLVNTLLDFSRIEAGRVQAVYEPTDLASYTAELASVFRSAVERAGMRLLVDCPPLAEPVYVDRDMWEKVVLNLLSNAFKYTLEGEIAVTLRQTGETVELAVRDTGVGIPAEEIPRLFERFHRVKGTRGRTHEGTGIGLALVQELVKLHGGRVDVRSVHGLGTTFRVTIPLGKEHLAPDRIHVARALDATALGATAFVEEALRWLPGGEEGAAEKPELPANQGLGAALSGAPYQEKPGITHDAYVLLADDNADMREYVRRLLSGRFEVRAVADGQEALAAIQERRPDLVLSDVMMPRLDGFGLLRALRGDPATRTIPVILLSARAGEESRVEGLEAGADDYLIKPFSARELLARVGASLELARVRREAARREEELRGETAGILESISESFVAVDADWRFIYVNAAAERIYAKRREDLLEKNLWAVFPEALGTVFEREYRRARTDRISVRLEEFFEPFGRWFEVNIYPSRAGGLSFFFRDVSERKLAQETQERLLGEARQAREEALAANRMKDEFLATLSHELRTPLNAILGWARLLRSGKLGAAELADGLDTIERNSKVQAQLIEDLLDISRIISGKLRLDVQRVDLADIVHAALASVMPAAEAKEIRIFRVLDPLAGPVSGDPARLQQIIWNLLSNAVKFTPRGGKIQVLLERVNSHVEISVIDTGQGIKPDFLPCVFDRFRQADASTTRKHGGLGLGLSIVRQLVEMHGGTVRAKSPGEGKGSTFTVSLPIVVVHEEPPEKRRVRPKEPGEGDMDCAAETLEGIRVLVVDDDPDARELVKRVLVGCRAEVMVAASVPEALECLKRFEPHVLVSDIGMPNQDGYDLIREIRARGRSVKEMPAVALTAFARSEDRRRALLAGFQVHVAKPVDPDELAAVVASLVGRTGGSGKETSNDG